LLDQGFDAPAAGSTTVTTLAPYGDLISPNDMHDEVCKKKTKAEQSEAPPAVAAKDVPKSPYQEKLDHVPTLVAVGLGGATGPAPKAMLDQGAQEYADVPIPAW
ncbi:D-alanyl-D-alanine carboxypeptidase, partial [Mesorhizobium sp. M00.F.Ca.ET.158.01.1.1]